METKKRKKILNICMALIILLVVIAGIIGVGNVRGWFGESGEMSKSVMTVSRVRGAVDIERDGVAFKLKKGEILRENDIIETESGGEVRVDVNDKKSIYLGEKSEVRISSPFDGDIVMAVNKGELFADLAKSNEDVQFTFDSEAEAEALAGEDVMSLSVQPGSSTLNVFNGDVSVRTGDGEEQTVKEGQSLSIFESGKKDVAYEIDITEFKAAALSTFIIEKALECDTKEDLCFTASTLEKILKARDKETRSAKETGDKGSKEGESGSKAKKSGDKNTNSGKARTCTITIRCDTILNNMEDLTAGKEKYVPSNGVILGTTDMSFKKGDTVFEVLKRVCSRKGIQLEYSWTPMYESYYIEGINHLYEFDCGNESGWMYKVNGWFPNYGCSEYTLKNGDTIVWCYTCKGLGADVGAGGF